MQRARDRLRMLTLLCTVGLGFYCGHEPGEPAKGPAPTSAPRADEVATKRAALLESLLNEQQKLVASDRASADYLGRGVALSADGNTAIVGAWNKADGALGLIGAGAVYVFTRSGTTWSETQKIVSSDLASGDHFGLSVALSADGKTALVGAETRSDGGLTASGAAYVFTRSGSSFSEQQKLVASDASYYDYLGGSVALSDDGSTAIVGAANKWVGTAIGVGAAYVFTRSGTTWSEQQKLTASDRASYDRFGGSVALSADGSFALVGADTKSELLYSQSGAAYAFSRSGTTWSETQKLQASDRGSAHNFGKAVTLSGDGKTAIVGAYKKYVDTLVQSGGAYVFTRSATTFAETQILAPNDRQAYDRFGYSASLSSDGSTALVGSYYNNEGGLVKSGAAYLYVRSGTSYVEDQKILSADRAASEFFGVSVALSQKGTTALVGADSKSDGFTATGAAYAFVLAPTKPNGKSCVSARECTSGFCADGVCCNSACGGGSPDCQACSKASGAATDGTCGVVAAATICRAAAGACDVPEVCDGSATSCPRDGVRATGTICRASEGACDAAEVCSGASAQCPADALAAAGTTCRASAGACDVAETCSGASPQCPADTVAAAGTVCRASAGSCDLPESCSGASAQCPSDSVVAAGTICRAAAGPCDNAEVCSGSAAACPADKFKSSATTCRAAAGVCDTAEKCSGSAASCPADKVKSNTTVCRASAGSCDIAEFCNGSGVSCPADQFKPLLVLCRPTVGACDLADYCTGGSPACPPDDFLPGGTICRPATNACDLDEVCAGTNAVCPVDKSQADGTPCTGGSCKAGMCI